MHDDGGKPFITCKLSTHKPDHPGGGEVFPADDYLSQPRYAVGRSWIDRCPASGWGVAGKGGCSKAFGFRFRWGADSFLSVGLAARGRLPKQGFAKQSQFLCFALVLMGLRGGVGVRGRGGRARRRARFGRGSGRSFCG